MSIRHILKQVVSSLKPSPGGKTHYRAPYPFQELKVVRSSFLDISVTIETNNEHHIGAYTVYLFCSRPIRGISYFQTTNGSAFWSNCYDRLFLFDATVILYVCFERDLVLHLERPAGWYFSNARIEDSQLRSELYNGNGERSEINAIDLSRIESIFQPGFGPVVNGRFPSAFGV